MEGEGRGSPTLRVTECAAQRGKVRFPRNPKPGPPAVARWRNNLTALSQCRNLYFTAYMDQIYVYQPKFPEQTLPHRAGLTFHVPVSGPNLRGEIDPAHPHAINQIVVSDLGNEELLVCVCDDGDVVAYATRTLATFMEDGQTSGSPTLDGDGTIKTFLHRNVGRSAWGIAIHKFGRLIAVSANSNMVTVFAFALGSDPSSDGNSEDDHDNDFGNSTTPFIGTLEWEKRAHLGTMARDLNEECLPAPRSTSNFEITLSGHHANVPNIAFCNTEDDPTGRYLVSTDIDGVTLTWDLWQGRDITKCVRTPSTRSWGVLCLDLRSFRLTQGTFETFGCEPQSDRGNLDISASRIYVKGANNWQPVHEGIFSTPAALLPFGMVYDTNPQADSSEESDDEDWLEAEVEENDELVMDSPEYSSVPGFGSNPLPIAASVNSVYNGPPQEIVPAFERAIHLQRAGEAITGDLSLSTSSPPISLPFSVLQTSAKDIIFRYSALRATSVMLRHPFAEDLPHSLHSLRHFDRLNMVAQVPELGLVLIASQVGRVALLTLTRMRCPKTFAFRLDCILPSVEQEERRERPMVPLLGMAVGPIQGREKKAESGGDEGSPDGKGREAWRAVEGSRRHRLLLYYSDHTVLGYELSRRPERESSSLGEDGLLVF
ncbi:WD40/YVTN repeat-like-containing domain [Lasallia pustulata]|uniref:WD40/YVTN repeat-like-containing domain n=1 Tax=Lasallia pustulata TaxID=136370 RepID=A0A1W5D1I9_9LECA|nr:WD40/YVTN repeat-like-containing domain [Lasallia pustulata]